MRTHTKTFHIRFTEQEYIRLCSQSKKAGLPKTTFIRHMVNGCAPKYYPREMITGLRNELLHIGNNLNQLTHLAHRVGNLHAERLDETHKECLRLYLAIYRALVLPGPVDIPATLERGRQIAEAEQEEQPHAR